MSKKFKRANKLKASYAIILGEEEVGKKVLKFKDLTSGKEELLKLSEVLLKVTND
jgi:histidyl-tRNA synthetase